MHDDIISQLSAYLDGELSTADHARIDAHVAGCAECRVVLNDLKAIVVTAPYYEGSEPDRDLWAGIQQGISGAKELPFAVRPLPFAAQRFSLRQLIAASLAFAAIAGGSVYVALRQPATTTEIPSPVAVRPSPSPTTVTNVASANARVGEVYDQAMGDLERVLAEGRDQLEPRTLKVIEDNLRIIDRAIAEARSAIAADPANAYLRSQVAANMRRKLDILRQATDVIRAAQS
jgi:hypothetical protein